ncbi:MAG: LamG-like jellyroll fold domain-containing protein [Planctomycetota bacterium]|jgi:hypothetical protein
MFRKLTFLISFALFLSMVAESTAQDVDPSLVGWWTFDEDTGDVARDKSGNGNDAVLLDGPTWSTDPDHRGIMILDGTDDHIYIDGTPYELPLYTMAIWFRVDGGSGSRDVLSAKGPTGVNGVLLEIQGGGTLRNLHRFPFASGGGSNIYSTETYDDGVWHHAATVQTESEMILYVDGQEVGRQPETNLFQGPLGEIWLGTLDQRMGRMFPGPLDDLRIYNRALSVEEIATIMEGEPNPFAYGPQPKNGARHEDTWANLKWGAGDMAVSHDLYFGTDFDAVNEGAEGTFVGNIVSNFQVVGFPGFPEPAGLQLGATYYWRIDEVNPAEPGSPWKGKVWSFTVPPKEAYNPDPADGARFLGTGLTLSWAPGIGAKLHTVYFGSNPDDVTGATGGASQTPATYDPSALESGTTYYWRIDEFDGAQTYTGNLWSFTTAGAGGGLKGEYFNNPSVSGEPVLTRLDPGIDFTWGTESPGPGVVNDDDFSVRWRGELEIAFTEAYRFYAATEDGVKLWVNDQLAINRWDVYRLNEYRSDPIELQAGQKVSIEMWGRDNEAAGESASATAQLMWESAHQAKAIIPAVAFSPPVRAGSPKPANGAVDTRQTLELKWIAGDNAAQHDVYFGADADAVAAADTGAAGIYQGRQTETGFSPPKLDWGATYYWRVDEINDVNPDSPWKGPLWSFTTATFLVVDDFEFYTDDDAAGEAIWQAWIDGFGVPANGSQVGYLLPPYTEQAIVHGGRQSMPFSYDNTAGITNSEAVLTLTYPRDWTEQGVEKLSLWFRGYPASVGSFTEGPAGTYTMTASGSDIAGTSDQFHFAYKTLTGAGTIVARIDSIENTHAAARAGVMIRETLDAGSKHAFVCVMPENGVASRGRTDTNSGSFNTTQAGITSSHWVKLERDVAGNFTASHSTNGTTWEPVELSVPTNISMASDVYIGLALTSHNASATCEAKFSNVTITGSAGTLWTNQDIGIASNAAEPLYVAVSNSAGAAAVVVHDDPAAATMNAWTEWIIPLQTLADHGINLTDVDKIAIGLGTKGNATAPGGSGTMYFDDIRLYQTSVP